jgi:hypothetical protein
MVAACMRCIRPCAQVFELKNNKERVLNFAWEPKGHRFAVVHGDGPRPSISFFTMRDDKGRLGVRELSEWGGLLGTGRGP